MRIRDKKRIVKMFMSGKSTNKIWDEIKTVTFNEIDIAIRDHIRDLEDRLSELSK